MKLFYPLLSLCLLCSGGMQAQHYLIPSHGLKVAYVNPDNVKIQSCEVDVLHAYYNDGDSIYRVSMLNQQVLNAWGRPADYRGPVYPSFLTISPDSKALWIGYTNADNSDSRIYEFDLATEQWKLAARMPGNFELDFHGDSILVSGLNSADFMAPNGVFVLDTSGADQHRRILDIGGSSSGMGVQANGDLYVATSNLGKANALYRWSGAQVDALIAQVDAAPLLPSEGEKLSDLPQGGYDCEVDAGGNVVFTMNLWGGQQVLARWNGGMGDGMHFDTLAVSEQWLGLIRSRGNYAVPQMGNSLLVTSYGMPLADVHTADYPPMVRASLPVLSGYENRPLGTVDLNAVVEDLDDHEPFAFDVDFLSVPHVADLVVDGGMLGGSFGSPGQSNLRILASSGGQSVWLNTLVASWPVLDEACLVADFEDLVLDPESYWNGSDESGEFQTGPARFHNHYDAGYFTWSGWSYSNTSDAETPGFMNQYASISGGGFPGMDGSNGIYGVSSHYGPVLIDFPEKAHAVAGFFVNNATYAALSMERGDSFAKKFGGDTGDDPDAFLLETWGHKDGLPTDTVEFFLADYRSEENENDYIIKTWQWVDLSSLGKVDSLSFALTSTDLGDWGMNTPAYFCMDELHVIPDAAPHVLNPIPDQELPLDPEQLVIDVSQVFTDPDDDDADLVLSLPDDNEYGPFELQLEAGELVLTNQCHLVKSAYGEFEVILEASLGGLSTRDTFMVSVECTNNTEDEPFLAFQVYPNPSSGSLRVHVAGSGAIILELYSLRGNRLLEQAHHQPGSVLDLGSLSSGAYILRVRDAQRTGAQLIHIQ